MKLAVSTLALPRERPAEWLPKIADMGFAGVEVSPSWTWGTNGAEPDNSTVSVFRQKARQAGLAIVGLHSLLHGRTGMGLLQGAEARHKAVEFVVRMSQVCRDLGGRTLILGGERFRRTVGEHSAWAELAGFFDAVLPRIENHGTLLCLDPLGPASADFCRRAADCRMLINYLDHPSLGYQLDSAVIVANGDMGHSTFAALRGQLDIFHVAEPGLQAIASSKQIDHADFRRHLAAISFEEWLCLHQQAGAAPDDELENGLRLLRHYYFRRDNLSLDRLRQRTAAAMQLAPQSITG